METTNVTIPPIQPRRPSTLKMPMEMRLSSRNLYELQVKAANYEAMMQRFQLRKMSDKAPHDGSNGNNGLLSPRSPMLLTRRTTWHQVWQTVTSPILPGTNANTCHGLFMFGVVQFQIFYLPFSYVYYPNGSAGTTCVGLVVQVLYFVDFILTFNTAFRRKHELVKSRRLIAWSNVTAWLPLQVVSAIPVNITYSFSDSIAEHTSRALLRYDVVLMTLRILKVVFIDQELVPNRVFRQCKRLSSWFFYSRYSRLLGIAKLLWLVLLVAHYMACLWHVVEEGHGDATSAVGEQYVSDFYYAVQLIQGQGNHSGTWEENVLSTFVILTGSAILAIVFGNVAMLVSNFNANTTNYQQKMEAVFATMDKMGLPLKLRERVHQYYTHVWMEYESLDGDIVKFQRELAHTLGLEVGLYKYMNLVMKIPFWESCSPDFATQIILALEARVYLPDDYVVRKGDTGAEMFMINRGICEVSDPAIAQQPNVNIVVSSSDSRGGSGSGSTQPTSVADAVVDDTSDSSADEQVAEPQDEPQQLKPKPFFRSGSLSKDIRAHVHPHKSDYDLDSDQRKEKTQAKVILLYPGQAFGEMSLMMNYKRTANIRAVTYVETCIFSRRAFQDIISRYPEDRRHVLTMMIKSCVEKKGEIPFPWDEVVDAVAERRRKNGTLDSSRGNVQTTVTSAEAAEALVDKIDVNRPDESIKYGFQTFHPDLKREEKPNNVGARRYSIERIPSPSSGNTNADAASTFNSRVEGLEKTLAAMMEMMTLMSGSIERLENLVQTRGGGGSCKCCPVYTGQEAGPDALNVRIKQEIEARSAVPTNVRHPYPRRKSTSSISLAPIARKLELSVLVEASAPEPVHHPSDSMTVKSTPIDSVPAADLLATNTSEAKLPEASNHPLGWLTRNAASRSEPTVMDTLWRSKHGINANKRVHRNSIPMAGDPLVGELRTRSSFLSPGQSHVHQGDHRRVKRRGSRVSIDALTVPTTWPRHAEPH